MSSPEKTQRAVQDVQDLAETMEHATRAIDRYSELKTAQDLNPFSIPETPPAPPDPDLNNQLRQLKLAAQFAKMDHHKLLSVVDMWLGKKASAPSLALIIADPGLRERMRQALISELKERLAQFDVRPRYRIANPNDQKERQSQLRSALATING